MNVLDVGFTSEVKKMAKNIICHFSSISPNNGRPNINSGENMKFKVWDAIYKCFYDAEESDFYLNGAGELVEYDCFEGMCRCESHLKPIFSTEINDKNGVELFDGDILFCKRESYKGTVFFLDGSWMTDAEGFGDQRLTDGEDFEKIGTKFENPELLED